MAILHTHGITNFSKRKDNDKDYITNLHISEWLNRMQSIFHYTGLPETVPERILELWVQCNGHVAFLEHNGTYYIISGDFAGELNYNYMPKEYSTVNPYIPTLPPFHTVNENCVIIPNDSLYMGLLPILKKYAWEETETDISMRVALINSRLEFIMGAPDSNTRKNAVAFLEDVESGKLGVIQENAFLDGLKVSPTGRAGAHAIIQQLDEHRQYLRGTLFNTLGLDANYNMKRERLTNGETELNADALLPLVDNMLSQRRIALEKINAMYGLSITVDFASSWKLQRQEIESEITERDDDVKEGENNVAPTE